MEKVDINDIEMKYFSIPEILEIFNLRGKMSSKFIRHALEQGQIKHIKQGRKYFFTYRSFTLFLDQISTCKKSIPPIKKINDESGVDEDIERLFT